MSRLKTDQSEHALRDTRTGILNRTAFYSDLRTRLSVSDDPFVLLGIDIFGVEDVLVNFGPDERDQLVLEASRRIATELTAQHELYHVLEGRFVVVMALSEFREAVKLGHKLVHHLQQTFHIGGVPFRTKAIFGISRHPNHGRTGEELARALAVALRFCRQTENVYEIYDTEWDRHQRARFALLNELREALEAGSQLELAYQPKIDLSDGRTIGAEALVRWHHPRRGEIPPGQFVPLCEDTALIQPLTEQILALALETLTDWHRQGLELSLAVNLSPGCLREQSFLNMLEDYVRFYGAPTPYLEFEVTETAVMHNATAAKRLLGDIRERGMQVSVDDFGTGHSALSYLTDLPVDAIKLDQWFLRSLEDKPQNEAIVHAATTLAHDLGLKVVAEGVEDRRTYDSIRGWGCDMAQGFFIARPMYREAFETWYAKHPLFDPRQPPA